MLIFLGVISFVVTIIWGISHTADGNNKQAFISIVVGTLITASFLASAWLAYPHKMYTTSHTNGCLLLTEKCTPIVFGINDSCRTVKMENICKEGVLLDLEKKN